MRPSRPTAAPALTTLLVLLAAAGPVVAQYKVVGPDGRVTYTDRPPAASEGKVSAIGLRGSAAETPSQPLPAELRAVTLRYPVTLYTSSDCRACDEGRELLRSRGIPYAEKTVAPGEDAAALERLTGALETPVLAIGPQQLRGLTAETWQQYLDLAGYPRASRLPPGWKPPVPTPLVERKPPPAPAPAPLREAGTVPAPLPADAPTLPTFRF